MAEEPFKAAIESGHASAAGVVTILETTAEAMREKDGRFEIALDIRERDDA